MWCGQGGQGGGIGSWRYLREGAAFRHDAMGGRASHRASGVLAWLCNGTIYAVVPVGGRLVVGEGGLVGCGYRG